MKDMNIPNNLSAVPIFGKAVFEIAENSQTPTEMAVSVLISAIALAMQADSDVCLPIGKICPVSVSIYTRASSGDRKSTVFDIGMAAIHDRDRALSRAYKEEVSEFTAEHRHWSAIMRALEAKLRRAISDEGSGEAEIAKMRLHQQLEPVAPEDPRMLYQDTTAAALFASMKACGASVGLVSSEGGVILNGIAGEAMLHLNAIWSGEDAKINRRAEGPKDISNARISMLVMLQPETMDKFLRRKGEEARGTGMMARVLLFAPRTLRGNRRIDLSPKSTEATLRFNGRIAELLDESDAFIKGGSKTRRVIRFDPQAARLWAEFAEFVESETRPGGVYFVAADHASKLAENAARIAALLHRFEGYDGEISAAVLRVAIDICLACSDVYLATIPEETELMRHAKRLNDWLTVMFRVKGHSWVMKSHIRRYGPNALRENLVLDEALHLLAQHDQVRLEQVPGRRISTRVWVNPLTI